MTDRAKLLVHRLREYRKLKYIAGPGDGQIVPLSLIDEIIPVLLENHHQKGEMSAKDVAAFRESWLDL